MGEFALVLRVDLVREQLEGQLTEVTAQWGFWAASEEQRIRSLTMPDGSPWLEVQRRNTKPSKLVTILPIQIYFLATPHVLTGFACWLILTRHTRRKSSSHASMIQIAITTSWAWHWTDCAMKSKTRKFFSTQFNLLSVNYDGISVNEIISQLALKCYYGLTTDRSHKQGKT